MHAGIKAGVVHPEYTRKTPRGYRGTLYGGLMAGAATPEEASEGRWNGDECRAPKGRGYRFPALEFGAESLGGLRETDGSLKVVDEIRGKFVLICKHNESSYNPICESLIYEIFWKAVFLGEFRLLQKYHIYQRLLNFVNQTSSHRH